MGGGTIFYLVSTVISLYAAYLFTFKLYYSFYGERKERFVVPYIVYIAIFLSSFVPILNIILSIIFFLFTVIDGGEDFMVDSWLFKKPGNNKDEE